MRKFNKKGFTLVELLVTIVLLGIVATIIIYNMTGVTQQTTESDYEKFVAKVKSAASVYADTNPDIFGDLYINRAYIYITVKDLVANGFLDEDTINPYTGERIGFDEIVKVNLDSTNGQLNYIYPLTDDEKTEVFMVAISDYIVWGEPGYDCMNGGGSYQLALSDEDGNLIDIDPTTKEGKDNIEKYHVTCSLPEGMIVYNDEEQKSGAYNPGTYKITYNWLTESGTKKQSTRDLRVMPKVVPTFKTNYEYKFGDYFTPSYNGSTWKTLRYLPYIEQASEGTTYTIETTVNGQNKVINGSYLGNDFSQGWQVYDGIRDYTISTTISGHYIKDYSYKTSHTEKMGSQLIIPSQYVVSSLSQWATSKNFTIRSSDEQSPVGIQTYEFRMYGDGSEQNGNFAKADGNKTTRTLGLNECVFAKRTFPLVQFRAINKEGYEGEWVTVTGNVTNELNKLTYQDCKNNNSCYYTSKQKYIKYSDQKFIVLERNNDGSLIVALDGTWGAVSPMSIVKQMVSIQTCNGTITVEMEAIEASLQMIIDAGNEPYGYISTLKNTSRFLTDFPIWPLTGGNNYTAYVGNINNEMYDRYGAALNEKVGYWSTTMKAKSEQATYGSYTTTTNNFYFYYVKSKVNENKGTIIINNKEEKEECREDDKECKEKEEKKCKEGDKDCKEEEVLEDEIYTGSVNDVRPIKPILNLKTGLYVCGGNGSSSNPYTLTE